MLLAWAPSTPLIACIKLHPPLRQPPQEVRSHSSDSLGQGLAFSGMHGYICTSPRITALAVKPYIWHSC